MNARANRADPEAQGSKLILTFAPEEEGIEGITGYLAALRQAVQEAKSAAAPEDDKCPAGIRDQCRSVPGKTRICELSGFQEVEAEFKSLSYSLRRVVFNKAALLLKKV